MRDGVVCLDDFARLIEDLLWTKSTDEPASRMLSGGEFVAP
jgi:hypothetical protein